MTHIRNVGLTFKITGKTASFKVRRRSGASKASSDSKAGKASTHFARVGSFSFKELTSVIEEKNATGIDQKKQRMDVANVLRTRPLLLAFAGKPTFRQKISSGSGAGSTHILVAEYGRRHRVWLEYQRYCRSSEV